MPHHVYQSCSIKDIEVECGLPKGYILQFVLTEKDKEFMRSKYWSPGRRLIPELVKFIKDKVIPPEQL